MKGLLFMILYAEYLVPMADGMEELYMTISQLKGWNSIVCVKQIRSGRMANKIKLLEVFLSWLCISLSF